MITVLLSNFMDLAWFKISRDICSGDLLEVRSFVPTFSKYTSGPKSQSWFYIVYHVNRLCREKRSYFHNIFVIYWASKKIPINLFYHTISDNKSSFSSLAVDVNCRCFLCYCYRYCCYWAVVALVTSLVLLVSGDVVAFITVVIFLALAIDFLNIYLADIVFFATTIVVTVAVALITIDTVSLVVITVIFTVFVPNIRIDVVCHTVINLVIVDFFCQYHFRWCLFADDFSLVVFIGCGISQFRWCWLRDFIFFVIRIDIVAFLVRYFWFHLYLKKIIFPIALLAKS